MKIVIYWLQICKITASFMASNFSSKWFVLKLRRKKKTSCWTNISKSPGKSKLWKSRVKLVHWFFSEIFDFHPELVTSFDVRMVKMDYFERQDWKGNFYMLQCQFTERCVRLICNSFLMLIRMVSFGRMLAWSLWTKQDRCFSRSFVIDTVKRNRR